MQKRNLFGPSCSWMIEPYILPALVALLKGEFKVYTAGSADAAEQDLLQQHGHRHCPYRPEHAARTGAELLEWVREQSPHTIRSADDGLRRA